MIFNRKMTYYINFTKNCLNMWIVWALKICLKGNKWPNLVTLSSSLFILSTLYKSIWLSVPLFKNPDWARSILLHVRLNSHVFGRCFIFKKWWAVQCLFFVIFIFYSVDDSKQMFFIKNCWWLYANPCPLVLEVTAPVNYATTTTALYFVFNWAFCLGIASFVFCFCFQRLLASVLFTVRVPVSARRSKALQ